MKRQIRRGVFETNSSSMHSLVVMKKSGKYTPEEIMDGIYLLDDKETGEKGCIWSLSEFRMEFGRSPFKILGTFADKWLYACASLVEDYMDDTYKELLRIALKYVPNLKKIKMDMCTESCPDKEHQKDDYFSAYAKTEEELVEYLTQKEKKYGIELNYWKVPNNDWWEYDAICTGMVDEDILSSFLETENITLEDFLTNRKYIVIQDGDEYCIYYDAKRFGLIHIEAIDHEFPNREE